MMRCTAAAAMSLERNVTQLAKCMTLCSSSFALVDHLQMSCPKAFIMRRCNRFENVIATPSNSKCIYTVRVKREVLLKSTQSVTDIKRVDFLVYDSFVWRRLPVATARCLWCLEIIVSHR